MHLDTLPHALDGSHTVVDDISEIATNEESVKLETDVEASSQMDVSQIATDEVSVKADIAVEAIAEVSTSGSNFHCSICALSFSTNGSLTRHSKRFHIDG